MQQKEDMRVLFFKKKEFGSFFSVEEGEKNMKWKQTMKYRIFIQTKEIQFEYERVKIADILFQKKTPSLIEGVWKKKLTVGPVKGTKPDHETLSLQSTHQLSLRCLKLMLWDYIGLCPQELRVKVTVAFSAQLPL